jgi:hypothetical protein
MTSLYQLKTPAAILATCVILLVFISAAAPAQTDDSKLPPTNFGAGYEMVAFQQHQEHAPGPGDDPYGMGSITLDLSYPLIHDPGTRASRDYNDLITRLTTKWWKDIGGPQNNSQAGDPDKNFWLSCTSVGDPATWGWPPEDQMLPGVISMSCVALFQ